MLKQFTILTPCILIIMSNVWSEDKVPQKVIDLANSTLAAYGMDQAIIKAVQEENAKNKTLAKVKELDKKWRNTPGFDDFMKSMMDSECGKYISGIQKKMPYMAEIFVMDNLGGNVAMTDKTSDYWQGDEAKFKESFKGGKGAVHIGEIEFDDSAQAYLVQVSVPVKDGNKVIGAITFGINIDQLD